MELCQSKMQRWQDPELPGISTPCDKLSFGHCRCFENTPVEDQNEGQTRRRSVCLKCIGSWLIVLVCCTNHRRFPSVHLISMHSLYIKHCSSLERKRERSYAFQYRALPGLQWLLSFAPFLHAKILLTMSPSPLI